MKCTQSHVTFGFTQNGFQGNCSAGDAVVSSSRSRQATGPDGSRQGKNLAERSRGQAGADKDREEQTMTHRGRVGQAGEEIR
jgi:hypothetical protein